MLLALLLPPPPSSNTSSLFPLQYYRRRPSPDVRRRHHHKVAMREAGLHRPCPAAVAVHQCLSLERALVVDGRRHCRPAVVGLQLFSRAARGLRCLLLVLECQTNRLPTVCKKR